MKKQKIQLIFFAVILILCASGYFLIKNVNEKKAAEKVEDTDTISVTKINQNDVTEIEYIYNGETIDFVKEGDTWKYKEDKTIPILQSEITTMLGYVCSITSDTQIDAPSDLSVYGLKNPSNTVSITLSDGSVVQVMIGDYLSINGMYYAMTTGDSNVYTIPSYTATCFDKSVEDLTETQETTEATE